MHLIRTLNKASLVSFFFFIYIQCNNCFPTFHLPTAKHNHYSPSPNQPDGLFLGNDGNADNFINEQRTCIEQFLTQRSIQSFMFLCTQCKDPHTSDWVERFLDSSNLLKYHGTGAFNLTKWSTWDSIFLDLMEQPAQTITFKSRRRGSRNNPFLKRRLGDVEMDDEFGEIVIDVDPTSLASRILAVREQIANELARDLNLVIIANEDILHSYEYMNKAREEGNQSNDDDDEVPMPIPIPLLEVDVDFDVVNSDRSKNEGKAFQRKAMRMLMDSLAFDDARPSPLRQGNFDLVLLLSLQESIHRVLRQTHEHNDATFHWFEELYKECVPFYFDGTGRYSRADDFLDLLLLTAPSVKFSNDGKEMGLIDPLRIVEEIIQTRSQVATEWIDIVSNVQSDHSDLRKTLFTKQMASWGQKEEESEVPATETGAFE